MASQGAVMIPPARRTRRKKRRSKPRRPRDRRRRRNRRTAISGSLLAFSSNQRATLSRAWERCAGTTACAATNGDLHPDSRCRRFLRRVRRRNDKIIFSSNCRVPPLPGECLPFHWLSGDHGECLLGGGYGFSDVFLEVCCAQEGSLVLRRR